MKKIMFNDRYSLTTKVVEGRKMMTRRLIKNTSHKNWILGPYKVGEILAVAQSYKDAGFRKGYCRDEDTPIPVFIGNDMKNDIAVSPAGWTNKMFVSANLMPNKIRITDVRIEQLQEISDEDCMMEGIEYNKRTGAYYFTDAKTYIVHPFCTPRAAFATLIDKVAGKGTWESNPFVFVYEFEPLFFSSHSW